MALQAPGHGNARMSRIQSVGKICRLLEMPFIAPLHKHARCLMQAILYKWCTD